MARPRNQEARREALIGAAGRAISERGVAGLRIRDIAAEAGMSAGSVLYYYPELDELVFEVHRDAVERYFGERHAHLEPLTEPIARMRAALESGIPQGPDDEMHRLLFALHGMADRSTAHAALMSSLFGREVGLYEATLLMGQATGTFSRAVPAADAAWNLVILEDGYGLHIAARNPTVDRAGALRRLTGYARSVTGVADL